MSIDWITVIAQLVNFLLLVWLLKKFLYQPILRGIAEREAEITRRLQAAAQAKEAADTAKTEYQALTAQGLANQEAQVAEALAATQAERDRLISQARQMMLNEQANWQAHLEAEKLIFMSELEKTSAQTLFSLTKKALNDLANIQLEKAIAHHLVKKLQPLAQDIQHSAAGNKQVHITSQTTLPAETQSQLTQDIQQILHDAEVSFRTNSQASLGIEIQVGGVQLAWTLDSYLEDLSKLLAENAPKPNKTATTGAGKNV